MLAAEQPAPRFGMVAGEASGDLLAALLLSGLKERWPALHASGIGGPRMLALGFESWWPSERLAVNGFVDALAHVPALWTVRRELGARLLREPPAVFVGIDAPDFNLGLEQRLRGEGLRCVHFVCPSIWAWRAGRAKHLARSTDHVLCLFPFEPELLHQAGVGATFVGHPLADVIPLDVPRAAARAALGLAEQDEVIALLPGSRRGEMHYVAPVFLQAAALLQQRRAGLRYVMPAAGGLHDTLQALLREHAPGLAVQLLDGRSHEALAACDVTLIASGTATLEAALFKRPMVIGYRVHPLNAWLFRRMSYLPWVGLPNILCNEALVPELLQQDCTAPALADAVLAQLDDAPRAERLAARFTELHLLLRRDTARCATDAIAKILEA
jgi:lipid-A-disaccharide synthase